MIQGTEQLLQFVTDLRESAEDSLSFCSHRRTAERCLMAAELIGLGVIDLERRIRKFWSEGTHWRNSSNGIEINLEEADRWVEASAYTKSDLRGRDTPGEGRSEATIIEIIGADKVVSMALPLTTKSGIYFLIKGGEIIYIGKSINVAT